MIKNRELPVLGVNTDPARSVGCLCNRKIWFENRTQGIDNLLRDIERDQWEFFYRQRLMFELTEQVTGITHT